LLSLFLSAYLWERSVVPSLPLFSCFCNTGSSFSLGFFRCPWITGRFFLPTVAREMFSCLNLSRRWIPDFLSACTCLLCRHPRASPPFLSRTVSFEGAIFMYPSLGNDSTGLGSGTFNSLPLTLLFKRLFFGLLRTGLQDSDFPLNGPVIVRRVFRYPLSTRLLRSSWL